MNPRASDEYLRNAVLTATPEQLQLMPYDGVIRFTTQAREAIQANDIELTHNLLTKAQRIVVELQNGLRPEISPQICGQMAALYNFVFRRLVEANVQRDLPALDEALKILHHMRETWVLLLDKLREERGGGPAAPAHRAPAVAPMPRGPARVPAPGAVAVEAGSFSVEG